VIWSCGHEHPSRQAAIDCLDSHPPLWERGKIGGAWLCSWFPYDEHLILVEPTLDASLELWNARNREQLRQPHLGCIPPLAQAVAMVDAWGPDCCLVLHDIARSLREGLREMTKERDDYKQASLDCHDALGRCAVERDHYKARARELAAAEGEALDRQAEAEERYASLAERLAR